MYCSSNAYFWISFRCFFLIWSNCVLNNLTEYFFFLMFIFVVLQMCSYTRIYLVLPAGRQEHVNVTCHYVIPTSPPSTTIETTSGVISSQTTDLIVKSTRNIIENNSNKTLELSTQVIDTTNKGNPITTPVILETTRGTSAGENSNLTVMTPQRTRWNAKH